MLEVVSATKLSEPEFWSQSALGQSLKRLSYDPRIKPRIHFSNKTGLPEIYNQHIDSNTGTNLLVFVHDDLWLEDTFLVEHVEFWLQQFDVIGLVGNLRRVPHQPAWAFVDDEFTWDEQANLSGVIGQAQNPFSRVFSFGISGVACELLDGVFLGARKSTLRNAGVRFDDRFKFHLYDLDFCRTARREGLTLGTCQINATHQSLGGFTSEGWRSGLEVYRQKWGD